MTAGNSLKIMLMPDEVHDTGPPEPIASSGSNEHLIMNLIDRES